MFKKLRRRLLLTNLSIITVLMFIAFASIYAFTYNNIQTTIQEDLAMVSEFKRDNPPPSDTTTPQNSVDTTVVTLQNIPNTKAERPIDRIVTFNITVNEIGEITSTSSFFDAEDTFYETALLDAIDEGRDTGNISLDGNDWAYNVSYHGSNKVYVFLDITTQQAVLDRLVYTFLIVFVAAFVSIYFISLFLTNRSIAPIKDAFEKQRRFISDASHELKTPLAVIQTNVDVLMQNDEFNDLNNQKWLSYIKNEVQRMSHLTKDLLYLTQMNDDESQNILDVSFDISSRIENQLLGLEVVAFEKNISLNYNIEPAVMLKGNSEQLMQVVLILIDNAIKYTPAQGSIDLTLYKTTHHVYLTVENTGDGIPEKDLPYIFDRFYRVDKARSRQSESYGLGLSIAKAIVDRHHGKISCTSEPGKSTVFTVKFKL